MAIAYENFLEILQVLADNPGSTAAEVWELLGFDIEFEDLIAVLDDEDYAILRLEGRWVSEAGVLSPGFDELVAAIHEVLAEEPYQALYEICAALESMQLGEIDEMKVSQLLESPITPFSSPTLYWFADLDEAKTRFVPVDLIDQADSAESVVLMPLVEGDEEAAAGDEGHQGLAADGGLEVESGPPQRPAIIGSGFVAVSLGAQTAPVLGSALMTLAQAIGAAREAFGFPQTVVDQMVRCLSNTVAASRHLVQDLQELGWLANSLEPFVGQSIRVPEPRAADFEQTEMDSLAALLAQTGALNRESGWAFLTDGVTDYFDRDFDVRSMASARVAVAAFAMRISYEDIQKTQKPEKSYRYALQADITSYWMLSSRS